jgi:hypothetical protein
MKKKALMLMIAGIAIVSQCFGQAPEKFAPKKYIINDVKAAFTIDPSSSYFSSLLRQDFKEDTITVTPMELDSTYSKQRLQDSCSAKLEKQTKLWKSHPPTVLAAMYNMITAKPEQLSIFHSNVFFIVISDHEGSTTFACILSKIGDHWLLRCMFFEEIGSIDSGSKLFFIS